MRATTQEPAARRASILAAWAAFLACYSPGNTPVALPLTLAEAADYDAALAALYGVEEQMHRNTVEPSPNHDTRTDR